MSEATIVSPPSDCLTKPAVSRRDWMRLRALGVPLFPT